jgi:ribonuclease HI
MAKQKYYVVWKGISPGIYTTWPECKAQVDGYRGAKYKSYNTKELAQEAFDAGPQHSLGISTKKEKIKINISMNNEDIVWNSISVDAACSGNPGDLEYRGVYTETGEEIFRHGPFPQGTNNIGEFLAIIDGLIYLQEKQSKLPLYTDSSTAMAWLRKKAVKTTLNKTKANIKLFKLIDKAETWLKENEYKNEIMKWDTKNWGEIKADYGRK